MNNMYGMDPVLARQAMDKIKSMKSELDTESRNTTSVLREKVSNAFAGTQTGSMQGFIDRINAALEKLYTYLDGNESNFALTFEKTIQSYETSDENVSQTYANSQIEQ